MRLPVPKRQLVVTAGALGALALSVVVAPALLSASRLPGSLTATTTLLLAALGMTLLLVHGLIDLSVGEQLVIGAAVTTALAARGVPLGFIVPLVLITGMVLGAINGTLVAVLGFPPFVTTFATAVIFGGGLRWLLPAPPASLPRTAVWLGLPSGAAAALLAAMGLALLFAAAWALRRRRLASTPPLALFVTMGGLAALGGLAEAVRAPPVPMNATAALVRIIAAALIGGAALPGRRFAPVSTLLGAITVGSLATAFSLRPILAPWASAADGLLLLAALAIDGLVRRARAWPPLVTASFEQAAHHRGSRSHQSWLLGLAILVGSELAVLGIFGRNFVSLANFGEIARLTTEVALVTFPMAWILATGGIDFSPPGIMALCAVALALALKPFGVTAAVALALVLGTAAGGGNGLLVAGLRLPAGLVTLGSYAVLRSAAEALTSRPRPTLATLPPVVRDLANHLIFDFVPLPLAMLAAVSVALHLLALAARRWDLSSMVSRRRRQTFLHCAMGLLGALAAILVAAHGGAARPDAGDSFALLAITAGILAGACAVNGPSVGAAVLASLAVVVLLDGLPLADISPPVVRLSLAVLMLAALGVSVLPGAARKPPSGPAAGTGPPPPPKD